MGAAEQWRFLSPVQKQQERTEEELIEQRKRRDAFKRKLLLENNPFLHKNSKETVDEFDVVGDVDVDSSGDDSDNAFKSLAAVFSNKAGKRKGKERATVASQRKKAAEEVGPSGQTYTPLENQVKDNARNTQRLNWLNSHA